MMQLSRNSEKESMRTQGAQICDGYIESSVTDSWQTCVCAAGVHSFIHFTTLLFKQSRALPIKEKSKEAHHGPGLHVRAPHLGQFVRTT
eukprot:16052-Heterococcus_DN1.PRE.4